MPTPKASVSTINDLLKLGRARTRIMDMAVLRTRLLSLLGIPNESYLFLAVQLRAMQYYHSLLQNDDNTLSTLKIHEVLLKKEEGPL